MDTKPQTVEEYLQRISGDRKPAFLQLRQCILENLPPGFEEAFSYGMVAYVVPHSIYPDGYHCDAKQPLPFISIANQKNFIAMYHMGLYANEELLQWFKTEYPKHSNSKLDMGKSCIRFKKPDQIPFDLIAELTGKITVEQWVNTYEAILKKQP